MRLSDQALACVMVALQRSLMEQSDIVPVLKGFEFSSTDDGQLVVENPPQTLSAAKLFVAEQDTPNMSKESRPWGWYTVLKVEQGYKLKEIVVKPSQRLSYQSHSQRRESWTITEGYAKITLDGVEKLYTTGDTVIIDVGTKHRVENASEIHNLTFIEVQTGSYFGEDDIVRYEDDYGRLN